MPKLEKSACECDVPASLPACLDIFFIFLPVLCLEAFHGGPRDFHQACEAGEGGENKIEKERDRGSGHRESARHGRTRDSPANPPPTASIPPRGPTPPQTPPSFQRRSKIFPYSFCSRCLFFPIFFLSHGARAGRRELSISHCVCVGASKEIQHELQRTPRASQIKSTRKV